MNKKTNKEMI